MKRLATTVLLAITCIGATTTPHAKGIRAIIVSEVAERLPRYNEEFLKRAEYPPCNTRS